jgi:hypothetical protein
MPKETVVVVTGGSSCKKSKGAPWIACGTFDPSTGLFPEPPTVEGSGKHGKIKNGNTFESIAVGTLNGREVKIGDIIRAKASAPGQDPTKWSLMLFSTFE